MVLWGIWNNINNLIWNQTKMNATEIIYSTTLNCHEWNSTQVSRMRITHGNEGVVSLIGKI